MKKTNSCKQNMTASQKISGWSRTKEAQARRKVNEDWQIIESTGKYRKAVARGAGWKRRLRRIVEKRQAQAIHAKTRNSRDRKTAIAIKSNTSKCLERLHNLRFAC